MTFLLDTNVVSEWRRPCPDPGVIRWLEEFNDDQCFISVVTIAELRHGIIRMAQGLRRRQLDLWVTEELISRFETRILSVDLAVAATWGHVVARTQAQGRSIEPMDAFIAATAECHGLTLVTRNVKDFEFLGIRVFNPWSELQV